MFAAADGADTQIGRATAGVARYTDEKRPAVRATDRVGLLAAGRSSSVLAAGLRPAVQRVTISSRETGLLICVICVYLRLHWFCVICGRIAISYQRSAIGCRGQRPGADS
jgi:hypothetical protein